METWKIITKHPGYEVSDHGRVRRVKTGRIRALTPNEFGYLGVIVYKAGKQYRLKVHQIVCEAFVSPRPPGLGTRHLDGNKLHNRPANLCWGTQQENVDDTLVHGTRAQGEKVGTALLLPIEVTQIRQAYALEVAVRSRARRNFNLDLAKRYGVAPRTIRAITKRLIWRHL